MCRNSCRRIYSFRIIAACVFWALILLSPQPSDGVVPDGEYGSFYDHYGDDLEHLLPGDVLEKQGTGALILIYDFRNYFQMHTSKITEDQREITCHLYFYPRKQDAWPRMLRKVGRVPDPTRTLALVDRFLIRVLPFHWNWCTKFDYMNYILYGQVTRNERFKGCPLAAPWRGVRVRDISSGKFKLKDSNGVEYSFEDFNFSKQGAESAAQRSESFGQLARTTSGLQHARSMSRMVKNPFQSMSRKKGLSV